MFGSITYPVKAKTSAFIRGISVLSVMKKDCRIRQYLLDIELTDASVPFQKLTEKGFAQILFT